MPESATPRSTASGRTSPNRDDGVDRTRMSFGDHLEELRARLIRALIGLVIGTIVALMFSKQVLAVVYAPLLRVLHDQGERPTILAFGVSDPFVSYLRLGILCGLLISAPWVLHQLWAFVSSGLYGHERRFVRLFAPASVGLFAVGVLFLYFAVLPIVLGFFVRFNQGLDVPALLAGADVAMGESSTDGSAGDVGASTPPEAGATSLLNLPLLAEPPDNPAEGSAWIDTTSRRLCVKTAGGIWSTALERGAHTRAVTSQFSLRYYVSFVLMLTLAFGLAFELPIALVFLAYTRLVTAEAMARARRYAMLGIVFFAAVLTPPDVISQILLAVPMVLLFEGGVLGARIVERRAAASSPDSAPDT